MSNKNILTNTKGGKPTTIYYKSGYEFPHPNIHVVATYLPKAKRNNDPIIGFKRCNNKGVEEYFSYNEITKKITLNSNNKNSKSTSLF